MLLPEHLKLFRYTSSIIGIWICKKKCINISCVRHHRPVLCWEAEPAPGAGVGPGRGDQLPWPPPAVLPHLRRDPRVSCQGHHSASDADCSCLHCSGKIYPSYKNHLTSSESLYQQKIIRVFLIDRDLVI